MKLWRLSIRYKGKRRYLYFSKLWKLTLFIERYTDRYFQKEGMYPTTDLIIKSVYVEKMPKEIDGYKTTENQNKKINNK